MRFTKIICTLGPATSSTEDMRKLVQAGMNVARINLSHGTIEQHLVTIRSLREINKELKKGKAAPTSVGILLDTKGAEIRTGDVKDKIVITEGDEVVFSFQPVDAGNRKNVIVNHEHFGQDVREAESILIDNGILTFELVKVNPDGSVIARAKQDGTIGSRRHVNLPGANLRMPSITPRDWESITMAAKEGVDFLALSFIREAKEVEEVRTFLEEHGAHIKLVSKIETRQSIRNIKEIISASDGIMIARGDLGVEVPFETVPAIQDDIVEESRKAGKPVIVATHMLESMIDAPMPTRAEVTDIAHAAMTRADATMLSGETASGEFPMESVTAMDHVLRATEEHMFQNFTLADAPELTEREARAHAAATLAMTTRATTLFVMTKSGTTARDISRFRPNVPILAFTDSEASQRAMQLSYGVLPILILFHEDPEETVRSAMGEAERLGLLKKGDHVVLVSDTKAGNSSVNTIQMRQIG